MKTASSFAFLRKILPAIALLTAVTAAPALTIETGPGAGPGPVTDIVYDDTYPKWLVADLTDPVNPDYISLLSSGTAGAWTLNLDFAPGSPNLTTGALFDIEQLLTIAPGSEPLSGWRQEIVSAGWVWESVTVFDYDLAQPLAGLSSTGAGSGLVTSTFDPISSPLNLSVVGTLRYTGPDGPVVGPSLSVTPVPEPGAAAIGLAASTLVLLRRRSSFDPARG